MALAMMIGTSVVLYSERLDDELQTLAIRRTFDLRVGSRSFKAVSFGQAIPKDIADRIYPPDVKVFQWAFGLSEREKLQLISAIFKIVVPNAGLREDAVFFMLCNTMRQTAESKLSATFHRIETAKECAISLSRVSGVGDDALLVFFYEKRLTYSKLGRLNSFITGNGHLSVTRASWPGDGVVYIMCISNEGVAIVDANHIVYSDESEVVSRELSQRPELCNLLLSNRDRLTVAKSMGQFSSQANDPSGVVFQISSVVNVDHGLFVAGWFSDPDRKIESVNIVSYEVATTNLTSVWSRYEGKAKIGEKLTQVSRFAAFLPAARKGSLASAYAIVSIGLRSQTQLIAVTSIESGELRLRRDRILSELAGYALTEEQFSNVYWPALAPVQKELVSYSEVSQVIEFGRPSRREVSIVIPVFSELSFVRSQLSAFFQDKALMERAQIIYVLDDPVIRLKALAMFEGLMEIFDLDLKLILLGANGGFSNASNIGVANSAGDTLVLMNSDVIPENSGWLEPLLARLDGLPASSVVGPKLLYPDQNIQHAGMYLRRIGGRFWQNFHYFKGYGRDFEPANVQKTVPLLTGACLAMRRKAYLDVLGFSTAYISGDFEDSDLCLKLRQAGGDVFYEPQSTLYHFERQSIKDLDGKERPSTTYNRALLTFLWGDQIALAAA